MYDAKAFLQGLFSGALDSPSLPKAGQPEHALPAPIIDGIRPDALPPDWRELYEERAAIREYEGQQAREHAEAEALAEVVAAMAGKPESRLFDNGPGDAWAKH